MAAGVFAAGARALALDANDVLVYSLGPVRVRPQISVSERYDDNIFYQGDKSILRVSPEDDFITTVSPAVNFQLGRTAGNHILFRYQLDQAFYARNYAENHQDHLFLLNTRIDGNRLSLYGTDSVQFLSGILGGGFGVGRSGQRVDRLIFLNHYRVEYDLSEKISTYVAGAHDATDYEKGTGLFDENTLRGTVGFTFAIMPKLRLFGEGYYGQTAVDPNRPFNPADPSSIKGPHQDFLGGFIGASGDFHPRLTGSVKLGYETRSFSDDPSTTGSPVVDVSLTGKIDDKTTAVLSYARHPTVSVQAASQSYDSYLLTARLERMLSSNGKLVASLGGSFGKDKYADTGAFAGRNDEHYHADFALIYNIQLWLSTSLAYEFERYVSNQRTIIDYDVNRITLRVSVGY